MYTVSVFIVLAGTVNKFNFNSVLTVPTSTVNTLTLPFSMERIEQGHLHLKL